MDIHRARIVLAQLRAQGAGILAPDVLQALGVLLDQTAPTVDASAAPSPAPVAAVQPSASGAVGFVGVLRLPEEVWLDDSDGWVPYEDTQPALAWNRLLSWGGPGRVRPEREGETWLQAYVRTLLRGLWIIQPIQDPDTLVMAVGRSMRLSIPVSTAMFQPVEVGGIRHWELRRGTGMYDCLTLFANAAAASGYPPEREIACGDGRAVRVPLQVYRAGLQQHLEQSVSSVEDYVRWTERLADRIRSAAGEAVLRGKEVVSWEQLSSTDQEGWLFWVRNHPGMLRLELALRGFFANGGQEALVSVCMSQEHAEPGAAAFLDGAFSAPVQKVCAPGLSQGWQSALAHWGAASGVEAVCEAARFADAEPPEGVTLDGARWTAAASDYEAHPSVSAAPVTQDRLGAQPSDAVPWLNVENPLAMGSYDAVRLAPPSGHAAARAGDWSGVLAPAVET